MANSTTILSSIDSIIVSNGVGNINADNLRSIAELLLDIDIRATGTITADSDSPTHGSISGDFFVRKFYDMNAVASIDYENRRLYRMDGSYFDWEASGGGGTGTVTKIGFASPASLIDFSGSTPNPPTIISTGSIVMNLKPKSINYTMIQDVSGGKLLGRYDDVDEGDIQEINIDPATIEFDGSSIKPISSGGATDDIIAFVHGIHGEISDSRTILITPNTKGNFVIKRIVYVTKSVVFSGGPVGLPEFQLQITGVGTPVPTLNALKPNSAPGIRWEDVARTTTSYDGTTIPINSIVRVKNTMLCTGCSSFIYDVYLIGFYETFLYT